MELHPLAQSFAEVADAYERGRPDYPPAVVGALAAELGLAPGAPVLDLAAGTGKLTTALVRAGFDVVAVEPQEALCEVLSAKVGAERVKRGTAEAIPLPDASVAAVTVADGFHWFDQAAALREIRRVLQPSGGLAVLFNVPDWGAASWADELGSLISESRPEHPGFDGRPWQEAVGEAGGWSEPRQVSVTTNQPTSPQRLLDFLASMSWVAAMPEPERARLVESARSIIEAGETPKELPIRVMIGLTRLSQS
ncbi:MAG TPA: methyltransferase domain-containing protein [Thermoleophilaceae bacterium]